MTETITVGAPDIRVRVPTSPFRIKNRADTGVVIKLEVVGINDANRAAASAAAAAASAAAYLTPFFETRAFLATSTVAVNVQSVIVNGYSVIADAPPWRFKRVSELPSHPGFVRTLDRFVPNGTTDTTNGGYWVIDEDDYIDVRWLGAVGDAVKNVTTGAWTGTDSTQAFRDTEETAHALNVLRKVPNGKFLLTDYILAPLTNRSNVRWVGEPGYGSVIAYKNANQPLFWLLGATGNPATSFLTANAAKGASTLTLGTTSEMAKDRWFIIRDASQPIRGHYDDTDTVNRCLQGEINRVFSVDSATQITLWAQTEFAYNFNATPALASNIYAYVTPVENTVFKDLVFEYDQVLARDGSVATISIQTAVDVHLENLRFNLPTSKQITLASVFKFLVRNVGIESRRTDDSHYSIHVNDNSAFGLIKDCFLIGGRHLVAFGGSSTSVGCSHVDVIDCWTKGASWAGFDTHVQSRDIRFINCRSTALSGADPGGSASGMQLRGRRSEIINPHISGYNKGIFLHYTDDCKVIGGQIFGAVDGVVLDRSAGTEIRDLDIFDPVQRGISFIDTGDGTTATPTAVKKIYVQANVYGNPSVAALEIVAGGVQSPTWLFDIHAPGATKKWINVNSSLRSVGAARGVQKNFALNSSFDFWPSGTSISGASEPLVIADGWQGRALSSTRTYSRQPGFNGSQYCVRMQRNAGQTSTETSRIGHKVKTREAMELAGRTVAIAYDIRKGADYAGSAIFAAIVTGTGIDEVLNLESLTFPTGSVLTSPAAKTIPATADRIEFDPITLPAGITELAVVVSVSHAAAAAGAADYVEVTRVKPEIGTRHTSYEPETYGTLPKLKSDLAIAAADITDASANGRSLITAANYAAMKTLLAIVAADITDASANGRSLITAANYAAMKVLLAIVAADITDASANGRSLITAANYAAMRTLLGLGALALLNTVDTDQINNDSVINAKLANMVVNTLKGRITAGTGDPEDLTAAQVKTILAIVAADLTDFSANARSLVTAANYAAMKVLLAYGTAADANTGTTGAVLGFLNGNNTYAGGNTHSGSNNFTGARNTFSGILNPGAGVTKTIVADEITFTSTHTIVDTEAGAATDNLKSIYGGSNGDIIIIRSTSGARDVVLKHVGGGTAQLILKGAVDATLVENSHRVALQWDGPQSLWIELFRNF